MPAPRPAVPDPPRLPWDLSLLCRRCGDLRRCLLPTQTVRVCLLCRIICASQSFPPMPVIASIILLALIVAAVGEGGLMLALRLRSLLDFPFQTCPSTTTITTMRLGRQRRTAVTSRSEPPRRRTAVTRRGGLCGRSYACHRLNHLCIVAAVGGGGLILAPRLRSRHFSRFLFVWR